MKAWQESMWRPPRGPLKLPGEVTSDAERADRMAKLEAARIAYAIEKPDVSLPPQVRGSPEPNNGSVYWGAAYRMMRAKLDATVNPLWKIFNSSHPFSAYYRLFEGKPDYDTNDTASRPTAMPRVAWTADKEKPEVFEPGKPGPKGVWLTDEEYGYQHTNGLFPHFISKVRNYDSDVPEAFREFDRTSAQVWKPLLGGQTLKAAVASGAVYMSDVCEDLEGETRAGKHIIATPQLMFFVDAAGVIRPFAIKLQRNRKAALGEADIFTANAAHTPPNLWLGVKMHAISAEFQVHTLWIHALSEHLMMEPIWAALNQSLSDLHPLHFLLKPHMWNMIAMNKGVRDSLFKKYGLAGMTGSLQANLAGGLDGSVEVAKKMYDANKNDFSRYFDTAAYYERLGIDEKQTPPGRPPYHFRDETVALWNAILEYTTGVVNGLYPKGKADMLADNELQEWCSVLRRTPKVTKPAGLITSLWRKVAGQPFDPEANVGGDIRGFPHNEETGTFDDVNDLAKFLAMVIYQCKVRHSHVDICAELYYPWVPLYPAAFDLPIPKTYEELDIRAVEKALPDATHAKAQISLIEAVHVSSATLGSIAVFPASFYSTFPNRDVQAAVLQFEATIGKLSVQFKRAADKRAEAKENVNTQAILMPDRLPNSIWN